MKKLLSFYDVPDSFYSLWHIFLPAFRSNVLCVFLTEQLFESVTAVEIVNRVLIYTLAEFFCCIFMMCSRFYK